MWLHLKIGGDDVINLLGFFNGFSMACFLLKIILNIYLNVTNHNLFLLSFNHK